MFLSIFTYSQNISKIEKCISKGNADKLYKYLGYFVNLKLPDGYDNTVNKFQAVKSLKDFFKKNKPKSFTIDKKGWNNANYIIIGKYISDKTYKVYIVINDKDLINIISFEKINE